MSYWDKPRPEGWDYSLPDPVELRCKTCNPYGMCRTGNVPVGYVGTLSGTVWVVRCPDGCYNGLNTPINEWKEDLTT